MKNTKFLPPLIAALAFYGMAVSAQAEKFVLRFSYREYGTNSAGALAFATDTSAVEIQECADSVTPPLDPKTLETVYDTEADELQVVRKSDGMKLCVIFRFASGTTITSADGKDQIRQAYVFQAVGDEAIGTVSGLIRREFDSKGKLSKFIWRARIHANIPSDPEVVEGELHTTVKFVPGRLHDDDERCDERHKSHRD